MMPRLWRRPPRSRLTPWRMLARRVPRAPLALETTTPPTVDTRDGGDDSREGETGEAGGKETPIGVVPSPSDLDLSGLTLTDEALAELFTVNPEAWLGEIGPIREHYAQFGDKLPSQLASELDGLAERLEAALA